MPSVDLGAEVTLRPQSAATLRKRTASACSLAANSRARSACSLAWAASHPPCSAMPSCTRATSSSTSATASANSATCARSVWLAPGSAQRARAGQACWGQDRPSRNRSTRQRVRSTHLRGPRHGCSTQVITLAGPGRYDLQALSAADVDRRARSWGVDRGHPGPVVVRLRPRLGSINVELDDTFASFVGWVVPFGAPIVLIVPEEDGDQAHEALTQLLRIGYDHVDGYLAGGVEAWQSTGRPTGSYPVAEVDDLRRADASDTPPAGAGRSAAGQVGEGGDSGQPTVVRGRPARRGRPASQGPGDLDHLPQWPPGRPSPPACWIGRGGRYGWSPERAWSDGLRSPHDRRGATRRTRMRTPRRDTACGWAAA
jgi:hypothetical protein